VVAAAVVTAFAPYDAAGLDWFAGMAEGAAQNPRLALASRDTLEPASVPAGAQAVRLWDAVVAFAAVPGVLEFSRPRPQRPQIPNLRW
jgi:hypothetical protein